MDPSGAEARAPITTLRAAAEHVALASAAELPDVPLAVDAEAAAAVASAHACGDAALRVLIGQATLEEDASPIHLWPEHFDIAIELGAGDARATYGVSPGDQQHPRPYMYVSAWTPPPAGDAGWNAVGFPGAERPLGEPDADAVLAFWLDRRAALRAAHGTG
jgi:hypothetical protein